MDPPVEPRSFKERLDTLSELVEELETGELGLEEAIDRFERGRKLHQELLDELARYEKRLEKLTQEPATELPAGPVAGGVANDDGGLRT